MELEMSNIENRRICYCKFGVIQTNQNGIYSPILAVTNFPGLNKHAKAMKNFRDYFVEVRLDKNNARELFDISGENMHEFKFFESSEHYDFSSSQDVNVPQIVDESYRAVDFFYEGNPYKNPFDFTLNFPYSIQLQQPMREVAAIYLIMYFLGSLVRYHPSYLESLFLSREAWVLESFIKSVPGTFLRHMRNLIHESNFVYVSR